MDYEKSCIRKKEWLFFVPFFAVSVLSGKLVLLNSIKKSDLLNMAVIGLEWLFCIMLVVGAIYGIFKLIKKEYTLDKVWLFSGIFILLQFAGVYQFELLLKYYNIVLNNVVFHDVMVSDAFCVLYVIFLLYYVIKSKNGYTKYGLTKIDIMILFLLLLLPFLRSINLFIFRNVIEGVQSNRVNIITKIIFTENMHYSEKAGIAEGIMDQLMLINTYIDIVHPIVVYGTICVAGIDLFREKITWQKYLALAGTFIMIQYLGITYFDSALNYFDHSFYTANINMLYNIALNYSYSMLFIIALAIYISKKCIRFFIIKKTTNSF
jgi:hypothetical protein